MSKNLQNIDKNVLELANTEKCPKKKKIPTNKKKTRKKL